MSHHEFAPPAALQPAVKRFWTLEAPPDVYNAHDILPDSSVELVVNLGAPLFTEDGAELPRVWRKGLQTRPLRLRTNGLCQLVGVRLYPWSVLSDKQAALDISALQMALQRGGYAEVIATLQQFVSDYHQPAHADLSPLRAVGELLHESRGQLRISELAARCYLSPSQLERCFRRLTGVSPKTFARLVRFEAVRDTLFANPAARPADLAHDLGYTDQAHLIHDFRAFAGGRTPGDIRHDAGFLQYN